MFLRRPGGGEDAESISAIQLLLNGFELSAKDGCIRFLKLCIVLMVKQLFSCATTGTRVPIEFGICVKSYRVFRISRGRQLVSRK